MSQRQLISAVARLCCGVLVVASVGCQTYSPYGYGGYPGSYNSYPYYNQGVVTSPYVGGVPQAGVAPIPDPAYSGGMGPNPYNPGPGGVIPAPFPNVPNGPIGAYPQGADTSGDSLGSPGQFPGASSPPRPKVPSDRPALPPDDASYFNQGGATPPRTKGAAPPSKEIGGPEDFNSDTSTGAEKATQKLKTMENKPITGAQIDNIEFAPPVAQHVPGAGQSGIIQTSQHVNGGELRPYGRAQNGRAWFRGLVDYDEQEKSWYLIYNPEPDASDKHGGTISLVDHPHLKLFTPDDVVLVEGDFDLSETDHYGNPKYRAAVVRRLIP